MNYKIFMQIIRYEEFTIAFKLIETPKYTPLAVFFQYFLKKKHHFADAPYVIHL